MMQQIYYFEYSLVKTWHIILCICQLRRKEWTFEEISQCGRLHCETFSVLLLLALENNFIGKPMAIVLYAPFPLIDKTCQLLIGIRLTMFVCEVLKAKYEVESYGSEYRKAWRTYLELWPRHCHFGSVVVGPPFQIFLVV